MQRRRRSVPHAFEEILATEKAKLEAQVAKLKPGPQMDELLMKVSDSLPRPAVRVDLLLPYTRGDLVAEAHSKGEVIDEKHGGDGYELAALVSEALAARMHEAADKHAAARD